MTLKRIYGLDILRSLAILSVLIPHSSRLLPESIDKKIQLYSLDGVSLFFVLSGFLIGLILLKKVDTTNFNFYELRNFWLRRWFRTLPAFYVTMVILFTCYYFNDSLPNTRTIIQFLTFSQSLFKDTTTFYREAWNTINMSG